MEPRILMLGGKEDVINELVETLIQQGRDVIGTDNWQSAYDSLSKDAIDLVVIGAGLEDTERKAISEDIKKLLPTIPILWQDRTSGPQGMIDFVNSVAEDYRTGI
jgi:DNA-binding NtrC family response regulator